MLRQLNIQRQSWPLATPFRISRGVKTIADVVVVEIHQDKARGRGEGVPYPRYGESVGSVLEQLNTIAPRLAEGMTREQLQEALPPGAARNAADCALWDLGAALTGRPVTEQLHEAPLPSVATALTIGIDTPDAMHTAAQRLKEAPLIKVKLDATDPRAQLRAVRAGAPDARLIADPNESWDLRLLDSMQPMLVEAGVELIEQPLPAAGDTALAGFRAAVPICADESCHVAADLPGLAGKYAAVNIKLDKTGGLSGALLLLERARDAGMIIMCGCMVATSLSMAPAFHIARHARFVDLDGPLWLKQDHRGGVRLEKGKLVPAAAQLWGGGGTPAHYDGTS
jgi:L-alanine-DL-glutamate epimerase-like enolase superfamily enzyme